MRAISLVYHDVVPPRKYNASGVSTPGTERYKLVRTDFAEHLQALKEIPHLESSTAPELEMASQYDIPFFLTFDGGGRSAVMEVLPRLERLEWRGHFFIPTEFIGARGFLSKDHILKLAEHGHSIGSHSHSGHADMGSLEWDALESEWKRSCDVLSEILERPIEVASIPGSSFSQRVAQSAAAAGIKWLFKPGPALRIQWVDGCAVIGRYRVTQRDTAARVAALVQGDAFQRTAQWLRWNSKTTARRLGGELYARARKWYFER